MITMFFVTAAVPFEQILSAALLLGVVLLGVGMTLLVSKFLSATLLKGVPSSFALELPPYRRPQLAKVFIRSVFDRTLFVLGRAVTVAAPAGLVIWLLANIRPDGISLLAHCSSFLDPFGRALGLDGAIVMAFLLGFPANEIVLPLVIMTYLANGAMADVTDLEALRVLLVSNGWTWVTALCFTLFSLFHFPCATTCLTIFRETKSAGWTALAVLIPTAVGIALCFAAASLLRLFGL